MQPVKSTMGGVMPGPAIPGASASGSPWHGGHTWGRLLLLCGTNSWGSSTASGTQAPLEAAQRKEGMVHASPGPSCREASVFQRKKMLLVRRRQGRKGETGQLAPRTASRLCSCAVPSPAATTLLCLSGVAPCLRPSASHRTLPWEAEQEALGHHCELPVPEKLVLRIAITEHLRRFWFL